VICRRSAGGAVSLPFPAGVAARPAVAVVAFMAVPCLPIPRWRDQHREHQPGPGGLSSRYVRKQKLAIDFQK